MQLQIEYKGLILTHSSILISNSYLELKFKEFWDVVDNGTRNGYIKKVFLASEVFQRMNNGKISLNGYGNRNKYRTNPSNVSKAVTKRHNIDIDFLGVPVRYYWKSEYTYSDYQIQHIEY